MSVLVLGIGNVIMADDGVGVRVIEQLQDGYRFPPEVKILDGGTLGLDLLPYLEGVTHLLIVDALETGQSPGQLQRLVDDEIPAAFATKLSPHQMGLQDLLAVAILQGFAPQHMVLWGVQPEKIDMEMELSPTVAAQVDMLTELVVIELSQWGITPLPC